MHEISCVFMPQPMLTGLCRIKVNAISPCLFCGSSVFNVMLHKEYFSTSNRESEVVVLTNATALLQWSGIYARLRSSRNCGRLPLCFRANPKSLGVLTRVQYTLRLSAFGEDKIVPGQIARASANLKRGCSCSRQCHSDFRRASPVVLVYGRCGILVSVNSSTKIKKVSHASWAKDAPVLGGSAFQGKGLF